MKLTILIIASSLASSALASRTTALEELPTATPVKFDKVYLQKNSFDSETNKIEIFGEVTYSNNCLAKDRKFNKVYREKNSIDYLVYGADSFEGKLCPKIYAPIKRKVLIDTILVPLDHSPEITVNQFLVN